jgi:hypothetical protein
VPLAAVRIDRTVAGRRQENLSAQHLRPQSTAHDACFPEPRPTA